MIAIPIGIIITVVAVLETNADNTAVTDMKPKIRRPGENPTALTIFMAMRLCRLQRCIERAIINPPMKRKIGGLA